MSGIIALRLSTAHLIIILGPPMIETNCRARFTAADFNFIGRMEAH